MPREGRTDDQVRNLDQIAQLNEVGRDSEIPIIVANLLTKHVDAPLRALQPFGRADDADIIPHETPDLAPGLVDDDFLVAVCHPALVPWTDFGDSRQRVPVPADMLCCGLSEHEAFEQ